MGHVLIGQMTITLYSGFELLPQYRQDMLETGHNVLEHVGGVAQDIVKARLDHLNGWATCEIKPVDGQLARSEEK